MKRTMLAVVVLIGAIAVVVPSFFLQDAPTPTTAPEAADAPEPEDPPAPPTYPSLQPTDLPDEAFTRSGSGLEQAVIEPGAGEVPPGDHRRQLVFTLWHADDLSVAIMAEHPGVTTQLGRANLPPFLEEAAADMRPGERRQLRFGPSLGYGPLAPDGVRADAPFIAEVTLASAVAPRRAPAYPTIPSDAWQDAEPPSAILTPGAGPTPSADTVIRFDVSVFHEGELVHTTLNIGKPRIFRWGHDRTIAGVRDALEQMQAGETRLARIAPERGWRGLDAHDSIPAEVPVEALITLHSVEPLPSSEAGRGE